MRSNMETMGDIHVRKKVLRWGNGYGFRLTKKEMEELGLHVGEEAEVSVHRGRRRIDLSHIPTFHLGGGMTPHEMDRIVEEEVQRHYEEKMRRARD